MVLFSRFATRVRSCWKLTALGTATKVPQIQLGTQKVLKRWMSGGGHRSMDVMPSRLDWEVFKNEFHYFVLLGAIPLGIIIFYANVFIGPAELCEIPEDYDPKAWEYVKSPISQFLAKHVYTSYEKEYEKYMHLLNKDYQKMKVRRLEKRVYDIMKLRLDYKGWYWVPVDEHAVSDAIVGHDHQIEITGTPEN